MSSRSSSPPCRRQSRTRVAPPWLIETRPACWRRLSASRTPWRLASNDSHSRRSDGSGSPTRTGRRGCRRAAGRESAPRSYWLYQPQQLVLPVTTLHRNCTETRVRIEPPGARGTVGGDDRRRARHRVRGRGGGSAGALRGRGHRLRGRRGRPRRRRDRPGRAIAHLEAGERVAVAGIWQDDRASACRCKVDARRAAGAERATQALIAYLERVKHVGAGRAARLLRALRRGACSRSSTRDPRAAFKARRAEPARRRPRRPAPGTRCAPPARCTCCSRRTGWPGWCRASTSTTARARTGSCASAPYELTSVFGVGFATADRIARAAGLPRRQPGADRARRVMHVLAEAERDGSTCLPVRRAAPRAAASCSAGAGPPAGCCGRWSTPASWCSRSTTAVAWAYRPPTAALERELARARPRAGRRAEPSRGWRRPTRRRRRGARARPRAVGGGRRRRSRTACRSSPAARAPARRRRSG